MVSLENGLKNSLIVLEHLRDNEELKDIYVSVGTFTNCRECGLTFKVSESSGAFTWCVYEHRNSDAIIINGKHGYISGNGDLPYCSDSKWDDLANFNYNQHYEAAEKLAELIIAFSKQGKKSKV